VPLAFTELAARADYFLDERRALLQLLGSALRHSHLQAEARSHVREASSRADELAIRAAAFRDEAVLSAEHTIDQLTAELAETRAALEQQRRISSRLAAELANARDDGELGALLAHVREQHRLQRRQFE
jgi:hypothetical protein